MYISHTIIGLLGLFLFLLLGYVIHLKDELKNTTLSLTKERDQKAEEANAGRRALMSQKEHYEARLALTVAIYDHVALLHQEKGLPQNCTLKELCTIVYEKRDYCKIAAPSDISNENIEELVNIALLAEDGLLDYYQKGGGTRLYRKNKYGQEVPVTKKEQAAMDRHDYNFILEE